LSLAANRKQGQDPVQAKRILLFGSLPAGSTFSLA
jgi:hypothetical protein